MLLIQPFVVSVVWHHLPRSYHGPNWPSNSNITSSSVYKVKVICACNTSIVISKVVNFRYHSRSKAHQKLMQLVGCSVVDFKDTTNVNNLVCFFRNGRCVTCCRFKQKKYSTRRQLEFHIGSTSHILTLYLKSIALNCNETDPYSIEVQCPFLCSFRYSLLKPHSHYESFHYSGQYSTIYCNILRFIRQELLFQNTSLDTVTMALRDKLQLLIPHRIFGERMFSINDVCDAMGRQLPLDVLHSSFKTGIIGLDRIQPSLESVSGI